MTTRKERVLFLLAMGALLAVMGCREEEEAKREMLVAKAITRADELIGGPSSKGKVGDYLLENDRVRFIVAGQGQAWAGGVFGGTLLDADVQRKRQDVLYGKGWDSFGETFPLVNLMVANPAMPGADIGKNGNQLELTPLVSGIEILSDGSDGEALIRVSGRVGYMFETFKFLNKDFLLSFLGGPIELLPGLPALPIDELLNMFLKVNVYSLLDRLQTDFYFYNDYILHSGESYLTIRTTILTAPPSKSAMAQCPVQEECIPECPNGYALQEVEYTIPGQATPTPGKVLCPACVCAQPVSAMPTLNESEDIFNIFLGDLQPWKDPLWKGGLLGGDFLFFGSESNIFSPGLGFDENRKIFENMWQGVPTLASPLTFDWLAAVADNVSYAWVTRNPDRRLGADCPTHQIQMVALEEALEAEVVDILVNRLGIGQDMAESRMRQLIVDRRPFPLFEFPTQDEAATNYEGWKQSILEGAAISDVYAPEGEAADTTSLVSLFPEGVSLEVVQGTSCQDSKLLIPLFSTSATAVMTHKSTAGMSQDVDGNLLDDSREFVFERYLVVGQGDVGSVLETLYEIKELDSGALKGVVMSEETGQPVSHASVFVIRDPRAQRPDLPVATTYDELLAQNQKVFGNLGFVSQMQTDLGLDPVEDGDYSGPVVPGRYYLVAWSSGRSVSLPLSVEIVAGKSTVANLWIPSQGQVEYRIYDEGGNRIPGRITFVARDDQGNSMDWDGRSYIELGGSRYDHAIYYAEHSHTGEGTVTLPPGKYDIYVSRGFEYGLNIQKNYEVKGGQKQILDSYLVREVDTRGYISGDFHVHSRASIDSALPQDLRVEASAAEGLEFFVSTDHDHLTDYSPIVKELGLEAFLKTAVGVETTTFEFGHFNGFPMKYKDTDLPVHNPVPWFGYTMDKVWEMMRARIDPNYTPEEFVIQANHPTDGFMGYFSQMGLKAYDLERDTGAMEMCNPQTVFIPCDFNSVEIFNEKRFELFRTPTIAEKARHNECFASILKSRVGDVYPVDEADPTTSICGQLQLPPHEECSTIEATLAETELTGLQLAELYSIQDHCRWHEQFRGEMARCTSDVRLLDRKRIALEALKLMSVRYELERTPNEQAAYWATTRETDLGCDAEAAMAGCSPNVEVNDDVATYVAGCGDECFCEACVCAEGVMPECCLEVADGGTGWTQECASYCKDQCFGCGDQPCTSKDYAFEVWFALLNAGMDVVGVGNSDSHDTKAEIGLPRNFIESSTDDPYLVDPKEILHNYKAGKLFMSTGPILDFEINGLGIGRTVVATSGGDLEVHIAVQTASWFGITHIELYRNGQIEQILRVDTPSGDIVDFDRVIKIPRPTEDSWYVLVAYGLDDEDLLTPVYKRKPYGVMLIPTIIAMGAQAILVSFQSVVDELKTNFGEEMVDGLLSGLLETSELPDSFPMFPLAVTNPIRVDADGGGFLAINARDTDDDGTVDLPPFCTRDCEVVWNQDDPENPVLEQSICGLNQVCVPDSEGAAKGRCGIPLPSNCVGSQVETP